MNKLSAKTMRRIGIGVMIGCFVLGIALGLLFKKEDTNLQGMPILVFDPWAAGSIWLLGILGGLVFLGKSYGRS